jgi:hypothetical protein
VCRKAAGDCDIAESCTGSDPNCPDDAVMTVGSLCRKAAGACDVAESCSGTDPNCPADGMVPPGTTCRPSIDSNQCDPAEVCTGTSISCPTDIIYARPAAPTSRGPPLPEARLPDTTLSAAPRPRRAIRSSVRRPRPPALPIPTPVLPAA